MLYKNPKRIKLARTHILTSKPSAQMQVSAAEHGIFVSAHPRYESFPSKEEDALICVQASAGTAAVGANTNIHAKDCKEGV